MRLKRYVSVWEWSREGDGVVKKALNLILEEEDLIELIRILLDEDATSALAFLKVHFGSKARNLLEGG